MALKLTDDLGILSSGSSNRLVDDLGILPSFKKPKAWISNPVVAGMKGLAENTGTLFPTSYYESRIPKLLGGQGLGHPEAMQYAETAVKPIEEAELRGVPAKVGYGVGSAIPILAGGPKPFMAGAGAALDVASKIPMLGRLAKMPIAKTALGFGGYESARQALGGQADIGKSFQEGAAGGAIFHGGIRTGATLGKMLPTKFGERIGSVLGAAAPAAAMAPEGERIPEAIVGGAFGAAFPGKSFTKEPTTGMAAANMKSFLRIKDPKVARSVAKEGIVANNMEDFHSQLDNRLTSLNTTLQNTYKQADQQGVKINLGRGSVLKPLYELKSTLQQSPDTNAPAIKRVDGLIRDISGLSTGQMRKFNSLTASEAYKIKLMVGDLTRWSSVAADVPVNTVQNLNAKMRMVYGTIDKAIDRAIPETAQLNDRVSALIDAKEAAGKRIENSTSILDRMTGFGALGLPFEPLRSTAVRSRFSAGMAEQYPKDRFYVEDLAKELAPKFKEAFSKNKTLQDYVMAEAGRATPVEAELVQRQNPQAPLGLPAPKPFNPYQKMLPPRGQYGQSSAPTIYQGTDIPTPQAPKQLPFRNPEKGAKLFGEGFTATVGSQRKGQISAKTAQLLRTTPPEAIQRTIESLPAQEKQAAKEFMRSMWDRIGGKEGFARLFHGTSEENAKKIIKEGFSSKSAKRSESYGMPKNYGDATYFTESRDLAKRYASGKALNEHLEVVIKANKREYSKTEDYDFVEEILDITPGLKESLSKRIDDYTGENLLDLYTQHEPEKIFSEAIKHINNNPKSKGKIIESSLKDANLFHIKNDVDYAKLAEKAMNEFPNEEGRQHIRKYLIKHGYDGVVSDIYGEKEYAIYNTNKVSKKFLNESGFARIRKEEPKKSNIPKVVGGEHTSGEFYHMTDPSYINSIRKLGLVPGKKEPFGQPFPSDMKANYAYEDLGVALDHAEQASYKDLKPMLLKVEFPHGVDNKLFSRSSEGDLVYTGNIPPSWIKKYNYNKGIFEPISSNINSKEFQGFTDLTTKTLEKLKGRESVSKQFISDLTNQPELKQAERDTIRQILNEYPEGSVPVKEFADKVKTQLLPLKRDTRPGYDARSLPVSERGPIQNHTEHIYQSPIKTYAGTTHRNQLGNSENYFAHTSVEDLPKQGLQTKGLSSIEAKIAQQSGSGKGDTRRIIELQSDLFQKGNLENSVPKAGTTFPLVKRTSPEEVKIELSKRGWSQESIDKMVDQTKYDNLAMDKRDLEVNKLRPYENTWHERIIREEIKQASKDGKVKLQFPTGETAMKIEGLGENNQWLHVKPNGFVENRRVNISELKVGKEITQVADNEQGQRWIITDVLGDGKFKAVPKEVMKDKWRVIDEFDKDQKQMMYGVQLYEGQAGTKPYTAHWYDTRSEAEHFISRKLDGAKETFDISGKIDTNNPIYRFYEKEVARYLKRIAPDMQRITDKQGVTWYEINVPKEAKNKAIEAFGLAGATAAGVLASSSNAQAAIADEDKLRAILGEAENQGLDGMRALASGLNNRGKLQGVYGHKAIVYRDGKYYRKMPLGKLRQIPDYVIKLARQAIKDASKKDYVNGADHWENIKAFGTPSWAKSKKKVITVGDHVFYK